MSQPGFPNTSLPNPASAPATTSPERPKGKRGRPRKTDEEKRQARAEREKSKKKKASPKESEESSSSNSSRSSSEGEESDVENVGKAKEKSKQKTINSFFNNVSVVEPPPPIVVPQETRSNSTATNEASSITATSSASTTTSPEKPKGKRGRKKMTDEQKRLAKQEREEAKKAEKEKSKETDKGSEEIDVEGEETPSQQQKILNTFFNNVSTVQPSQSIPQSSSTMASTTTTTTNEKTTNQSDEDHEKGKRGRKKFTEEDKKAKRDQRIAAKKIEIRKEKETASIDKAEIPPKQLEWLRQTREKRKAFLEKQWTGNDIYTALISSLDQIKVIGKDEALSYLPELWIKNISMKVILKETPTDILSIQPANGINTGNVIMMNVGGPIWAMDWTPVKFGQTHSEKFIAVSVHHTAKESHKQNTRTSGQNIIQIWSLNELSNSIPAKQESPKFELGILHENGTIWDLKWLPFRAIIQPSPRLPCGRMGLLGCCFSDGTISVYSVPFPKPLKQTLKLSESEPLYIKLNPIFSVITPGNNTHAKCISWSPFDPNFLLCGTSDGYAMVWSINTSTTPIFTSFCGSLGIGGVCWSPIEKHIFVTISKETTTHNQIWKLENPFTPIQETIPSGVSAPTTTLWTNENAVFSATDEGIISAFLPFDFTVMNSQYENNKSCVRAISQNDFTSQIVAANSNGMISLVPQWIRRRQNFVYNQTIELAKLTKDDQQQQQQQHSNCLVLSHQKQVIENDSIEKDPRTPWEVQINRAAWSNSQESSNWIAFGGNFGVVFCQLIHYTQCCVFY